MKLANLAVAARMRLLIGMMLFGLIALCAVSLGSLRTTMMEDRKVQTKHQVESGASILKHFHALAQAGSLPEADAKKAATEALRAIRYDGNNYLFIVTTANQYVLLPPKPEMEGHDASGLKDTNGKHIIQEIVKAGTAGGDYIDYPRNGSWTRLLVRLGGCLARSDNAAGSCLQGGATKPGARTGVPAGV